jgi:hypothetical protein
MNGMYDNKISLSSLSSRTPAGLCYSPIMVLTVKLWTDLAKGKWNM